MTAPGNYNDAGTVFRIDPTAMFTYATVDLLAEAKAIGAAIENIFNIWQGLKLGWVGTTATEAQDFSDRMNATLKKMFGSDDDPTSGVLPKVATAIGKASINFGETEDVMKKMFDTLTTDLGKPGNGDSPPPRDVNDGGPVTEHTPPQ
jgi:hypothetical protein